jgi:alkylation response protein AidB-like acyl-CoA dehydrogenase
MLDKTKPSQHDVSSLLSWMRDYADRRINTCLMDERRCIPPYIALDFGNKGILGLQVPRKYGGINLSNKDTMSVLEQIGAIDLNLSVFVILHNYLGIRPIMNFAKDELREELLPLLATGRELGAFGLTEPVAGSNANAIESQAVLMPNGKVNLNGTKMWIGNASWAGIINVFLRYTDERGKPLGICGYVIRQENAGLKMGPELMTMGMRGMVQNVLNMVDMEVDPSAQLGETGQGLNVAQDAMMYTRLALGCSSLGAMKRCMLLMTRYADRRKNISTGRLLDNPISLIRTSNLIAKAHVLENLLSFVSQNLDKSTELPEEFLIISKVSGSEFLWDAADAAIQMLGGRGYIENNLVTKIFRDARVGRIFEGPTETMMHYMGSRFSLNSDPLVKFLTNSLQAKDIADQMCEAREIVKQRCSNLNVPYSGINRLNLANSLLGEIVSWGVLFAVSRNRKLTGSIEDVRIIRWVKKKFQKSIAVASEDSVEEDMTFASSEIMDMVDSYISHIGNTEHSLPGEEWNIDPYLKIAH